MPALKRIADQKGPGGALQRTFRRGSAKVIRENFNRGT